MIAEKLRDEELTRFLGKLRDNVARTVGGMPEHAAYVSRHCGAARAREERIALIHDLSPDGGDGTAFFRHRSTGFQTIDDARAPGYFERLEVELRDGGGPGAGYMNGDNALFERTALADARYNRALLYRSYVLHSGPIATDAVLSSGPAKGRLTVTAFAQGCWRASCLRRGSGSIPDETASPSAARRRR